MTTLLSRLRVVRVGILLSLLTLAFGYGLGAAFGAAEDALKAHLAARAPMSTYNGDADARDRILSKSWVYFKRAHLHANGLGTTSLVLILLLAALNANRLLKQSVAFGLGIGGLGYALYWLLAGLRSPAFGDTHAAKESLAWLAIPSAGLCMAGLLAVVVIVVMCLFGPSHTDKPDSAPLEA